MARHHDLVRLVCMAELVVFGAVLADPSFALKATDDPAPIGLDVRHRTPPLHIMLRTNALRSSSAAYHFAQGFHAYFPRHRLAIHFLATRVAALISARCWRPPHAPQGPFCRRRPCPARGGPLGCSAFIRPRNLCGRSRPRFPMPIRRHHRWPGPTLPTTMTRRRGGPTRAQCTFDVDDHPGPVDQQSQAHHLPCHATVTSAAALM